MTSAVGASTTTASYSASQAGSARGSRVGLEAQLNTYKKQLSDCINCDSAKTPEGKAQIEDLQGKVSTTQARIKELDTSNTASTPRIADNSAANISDVRNVPASTQATSTGATPGSLINTFA